MVISTQGGESPIKLCFSSLTANFFPFHNLVVKFSKKMCLRYIPRGGAHNFVLEVHLLNLAKNSHGTSLLNIFLKFGISLVLI